MYLARWDGIVPDRDLATCEFCLAAFDAAPPPGYTAVASDLRRYRLFERIDGTAQERVGLGDTAARH
jgi:hypothetical protein